MTILLEKETDFDEAADFDTEELLKKTAETVLAAEGYDPAVQISCTFTDEEGIRKANADFRGIDAPTDVLSFPMMEFIRTKGKPEAIEDSADYDPDTEELLLGDVLLCIPRVISQAAEYGHSVKREYAFLLVHSLLHLLGYDHIEEQDRVTMEDRQRSILDTLDIGRSLL